MSLFCKDHSMMKWVKCLYFYESQQAADDQHSLGPLLDFITLWLLIINLLPTGLRWPKCAIMGPAWKWQSIVRLHGIDCTHLPALNEFVSNPSSLYRGRRGHTDNMSFCIKGIIFIAQKNPPENEIAQHSSSRQSLIASLDIICWHKTWCIYSKSYTTYI